MFFQRPLLSWIIFINLLLPYSCIISGQESDTPSTSINDTNAENVLRILVDCPKDDNPFAIPLTTLMERLQEPHAIQRMLRCITLPWHHFDLFSQLDHYTNVYFIYSYLFSSTHDYTIPIQHFLRNRAVMLNNELFIKEFTSFLITNGYLNVSESKLLIENPLFRKYIVDAIIESKLIGSIQQPAEDNITAKDKLSRTEINQLKEVFGILTSYNDTALLDKLAMAIENSPSATNSQILKLILKYYPTYRFSKDSIRSLVTSATETLRQYVLNKDIRTLLPVLTTTAPENTANLLEAYPINEILIHRNSAERLTLSEKHLFWHQYFITKFLNDRALSRTYEVTQNSCDLARSQITAMLNNALKNERMLREQGKYVFYHAQQWSLYFLEDLYTRLWEIRYNQTAHNYLFTRFLPYTKDKREEDEILKEELRLRTILLHMNPYTNLDTIKSHLKHTHLLFLNCSLFGNINNLGSCSVYYLLENKNASFTNRLNPQHIFEQLQLNDIYHQYEKNITHLYQQFMALNNQGNLLQIALTKTALKDCLYFAYPDGSKRNMYINKIGTTDIVHIMEALYQRPHKYLDLFEFCLILTRDYALKPNNGIEIFAFNTVPADKWQQYCAQRDALLQKIARELAH